VEDFAANLERSWGSGVAISAYAPSRATDAHVRDYWARYQQLSASPAAAMRSFWTAVEDDVIDLLPTIGAPTLVLHPERELIAPVTWGRYMAERVPGAEFVALDSDVDLICVSDVITEMAEEIAAFVARALPKDAPDMLERALVTVVAVYTRSPALREEIVVALQRYGGRVQARPAVTAIFDGPGQALRAATSLLRELSSGDGAASRLGVGVHVGECTLTDVGFRGEAVEIAHRLALRAEPPGEGLLTATVHQLLSGSDLAVEPRTQLDGQPVFALVD
jgi:hypothetical protein